MNISLVMIVKNEVGGLAKAVESARPLVHEVIIGVDSKSSDGTLQLAQKLGDIVYQFDWCDDFSKTRNEALEKSHGDWNLILDGHEYIEQFPEMSLLEIPEGTDSIRAELIMENGEVASSERILRSDVRYANAVHNEPQTKKSLIVSDLRLVHDRRQQTAEVIKERNEQRKKMLDEKLVGDTFRDYWYLAQNYRGLDVKKAIEYYKKAIEKSSSEDRVLRQSAQYYLAQMYYEDQQPTMALGVIDGDELMEFAYLQGMIYFREGQYEFAIERFLAALQKEKLQASSRPVAYLEFEVYNAMSQCFYMIGQTELAAAAAGKALRYHDDEKVRNNLEIFSSNNLASEEKDASYYDKIYKRGYNAAHYDELYKVVMNLVATIPSPKILEIGCGTGYLAKRIIDAQYPYHGFDFSEEAVRQSRELSPSGSFSVGNVYDQVSYQHEYNTAIALEVLEHVDDLKVLSMLKSGTTFIGSVPTYGDAAHLRVYIDKQRDIVNRFKKYLTVEKVFFSAQKNLFIFKGLIK